MNTVNVFIGLAVSGATKGAYALCLYTDNGVFSFPPVFVTDSKITENHLVLAAIREFLDEAAKISKDSRYDEVVFHTTASRARRNWLYCNYEKEFTDDPELWCEVKNRARKLGITADVKGTDSILVQLSKIQDARVKKALAAENIEKKIH